MHNTIVKGKDVGVYLDPGKTEFEEAANSKIFVDKKEKPDLSVLYRKDWQVRELSFRLSCMPEWAGKRLLSAFAEELPA